MSSSCSSLSEVSSGMTWSSRPCTISVRCGSERISSSATVIDSTQRCRGAGNIDENDSWKPGCVAPSKRTWARSSLVSDLSIGEVVHDRLHVLQRPLEAPDVVEPLGDLERDAHAAHQHQLVHPLRVLGGEPQRDAAAEAVAHQVRLLDAERVHHPEGLVGPRVAGCSPTSRDARSSRTRPCRGRRTGSPPRAPEAHRASSRRPSPPGPSRGRRRSSGPRSRPPGSWSECRWPRRPCRSRGSWQPGPGSPCPCPACSSCRCLLPTPGVRRWFVVVLGDARGRAVRCSSGRRGRPRSTASACPRPRRSAATRPRRCPR